ncbi:MAG: zinc-binding dehydrogenase [Actinobacteria bacterium]|nr:MAG: zinc-binding dehydrogenase [Actinomycetota bacterium]
MGTPLDELRELPTGSGRVAVTWLGQAGFALRSRQTTVLVDPFLSPHEGRRYESALPAAAATGVDLVFCSHEHVDHLDAASAPAIATASPGATFVVPAPIVEMVTEAGIAKERVLGVQPGETDGRRPHLSRRGHDPLRGDGGHGRGAPTARCPLADQRSSRRTRGPRHRREPQRTRGRVAGRDDRLGDADPDAPRPVHEEPRIGGRGRGGGRGGGPRGDGPRSSPGDPVRPGGGQRTMRALVYLGPRRMELQEVPDPVAGPGDVVIDSVVSAVCGSDLHGFREASPRRIPPLVMGHETIGRIGAVGTGVDPERLGQRVVLKPIISCGRCAACRAGDINRCREGRLVGRDLAGGFAERFAVPATAAVPVPSELPDEVAVLTEPLANAEHVTERAVREGDVVFVIGSGPIGALMVRAAFLHRARQVIVTDTNPERLAFAVAQGAEGVPGDDALEAVMAATDGWGADVVIDAAGFETTWALGLQAIRPGGHIFEIGLGAPRGMVEFFTVLGKEATITGSYAWSDQDFARSLELLAGGALTPDGWLTRVPLADGQEAFEDLADRGQPFKVLLELA